MRKQSEIENGNFDIKYVLKYSTKDLKGLGIVLSGELNETNVCDRRSEISSILVFFFVI